MLDAAEPMWDLLAMLYALYVGSVVMGIVLCTVISTAMMLGIYQWFRSSDVLAVAP